MITWLKQFVITLIVFCIAFFIVPAALAWLGYGFFALYTGRIFGW